MREKSEGNQNTWDACMKAIKKNHDSVGYSFTLFKESSMVLKFSIASHIYVVPPVLGVFCSWWWWLNTSRYVHSSAITANLKGTADDSNTPGLSLSKSLQVAAAGHGGMQKSTWGSPEAAATSLITMDHSMDTVTDTRMRMEYGDFSLL